MPDAAPGTGDSRVNVADRFRPQAGTPRPHREQGWKDPKPAPQGGGPSARECLAAVISIECKLVTVQVPKQNCNASLLLGLHPALVVGRLCRRPGAGRPKKEQGTP